MTDRSTWPRRFPRYTMAGLALALPLVGCAFRVWQWSNPEKAFYLRDYVRTGIYSGKNPRPFVVLVPGADPQVTVMQSAGFHAWLDARVYNRQPLTETLYWPLAALIIFGATGMLVGIVMDSRYNAEAYRGRLLRGPRLVSDVAFNRETRGDGIAFQSGAGREIRIAKNREAHHIQIAGDSGSGKSTIVREILYQVEARGEVAIVFDPDREYIKEFFSEERGDWVLNPKDDRCPYWSIGDEAADEAEATAIAAGLFPDGPTVQKFFLNHTRNIVAFLLPNYRPTCHALAGWMAHPEEIDERVEGTEHAHTLTENAAPQRAGILGSLNEAGKPLRMMPPTPAGRRTWLAREWAEKRQGWLFITSTPDTIEALRPLQSMWLDMLILRLQNSPENAKRVWVVLDELAALNQLPQLHSALTRQRKSDNPIVLGFQGMSQIEHLYGEKIAQTILSQAFTNIILRTRESKAAHHLSDLIGKQELERIRETRPAAMLSVKGRSYATEKVVVPAVMESEIQGLDDLTGYFVQLDKVVKIAFAPRVKRIRAEGLVPRMIPPAERLAEEIVDEAEVEMVGPTAIAEPEQVELYEG